MLMFKLIMQLHKGKGGSTTNVQSYQPTEQEIRMQKQAADYSEAVSPNALWLNDTARKMLENSMGTVQVDYDALTKQATDQISQAQKGVAGLSQGVLPQGYQEQMENSIKSGVQNSVGSMVSDLGSRGVLSSSVTNSAMQGINDAAASAMAEQYGSNIDRLNGLYGQQASLAGQNIAASAAGQEAARQPSLDYWNASLGLNNGGTLGALNAVAGQGTTTSTQSQSGGSGLFGGILTGLAGNSGLFCFTERTKVKTLSGEKEIRRLKVGDKVMSYNVLDDCDREEAITEVMDPQYSDVYTVVCVDDQGDKHYVNTTATQPLLTDKGYFIIVGEMPIGTKLKYTGKVISVIYSGERKVYDLKVSGGNTYYADGFIAKGGSDEW